MNPRKALKRARHAIRQADNALKEAASALRSPDPRRGSHERKARLSGQDLHHASRHL